LEESWLQAILGKKVCKSHELVMVACVCHSKYAESFKKENHGPGQLEQKVKLYLQK
jgi:hypothetical protein